MAARKAQSLADAGFPLFVVAQRIEERLRSFVGTHGGQCAQRSYDPNDLADAALVIAATGDRELNARIVADARAAHVLVCDAAQGERGDFTMTAIARIGELTIGVDSGGNAPAFSARVAAEIAKRLGPQYGAAMRTLARMRAHVKEEFAPEERAAILRALADRPIAELAAMPATTLVCATRQSPLAGIQSRSIAARLAQSGIETKMLGITTHGDRNRADSIDRLGEINVFVRELERALRERAADYAVHSCKDLASELPEDMRIAAISQREDPRDAFCSERHTSFEALPAGAVVGTSSPRRRVQLAALRPDLRYETLRGNVDTRLRKLAEGAYDAIVLAMAGLRRLGVRAKHVVPFPVERIVPAVGQGALAIEVRAGDDALCDTLRAAANDARSELCIECERAALRAMRAGCSAPIGIHATFEGPVMVVGGVRASDQSKLITARAERPVSTLEEARALGLEMAGALN